MSAATGIIAFAVHLRLRGRIIANARITHKKAF
jgi:hypothetical protein